MPLAQTIAMAGTRLSRDSANRVVLVLDDLGDIGSELSGSVLDGSDVIVCDRDRRLGARRPPHWPAGIWFFTQPPESVLVDRPLSSGSRANCNPMSPRLRSAKSFGF